ncbi:MAG: DUF2480 family protein [Bacteroidetes bacterium]|nr:DUF2480 family protein [Bacteroidota bacterium]
MIDSIDAEKYRDQRVIIKGCSKKKFHFLPCCIDCKAALL